MKMTNKNYYSDFYLNYSDKIIEKLFQIKSSNPSKMSPKNDYIYYNAEIFLHGLCHVFAYALHQKFGYQVIEIKNNSGTMVHWFCTHRYKGKKIYIDVRGMTSDFNCFINEFMPDIGIEYDQRIINNFFEYSDEWEEEQIVFAEEIINKYYNNYSIFKNFDD